MKRAYLVTSSRQFMYIFVAVKHIKCLVSYLFLMLMAAEFSGHFARRDIVLVE